MFSSVFKSFPMKKHIVSYIISFILTLILLSLFSVVFAFFPPSERVLSAICDYCGIFSAFIAALLCSRKCNSCGYLIGIISACIYTCILVGAGCILWGGGTLPDNLATYFLLSGAFGAVGGIIGINLK